MIRLAFLDEILQSLHERSGYFGYVVNHNSLLFDGVMFYGTDGKGPG
jgi:hypothetical protein